MSIPVTDNAVPSVAPSGLASATTYAPGDTVLVVQGGALKRLDADILLVSIRGDVSALESDAAALGADVAHLMSFRDRDTLTIISLGQSNEWSSAADGGDRTPISGVQIRMWADGAVVEHAQPGVNPSVNLHHVYALVRRLRAAGAISATCVVNVVVAAESGNGLRYWDQTTKGGNPPFKTQITSGLAALGVTTVDLITSVWGEDDSTTFDTGFATKDSFRARVISIYAEMLASSWWVRGSTYWVLGMLAQWYGAPYLRNDALMTLATGLQGVAVVDSSGLAQATDAGSADIAHFDGASQDTLGVRFADAAVALWSGARPGPLLDAGRNPISPPYDLGVVDGTASAASLTVGRDQLHNGAIVSVSGAATITLPNAGGVPGSTLSVRVESLTGGSPVVESLQNIVRVPWQDDTTSVVLGLVGVFTFQSIHSRWVFTGSSAQTMPILWESTSTIATSGGSVSLTTAQCLNKFWAVSGGGTIVLPNPNSVVGAVALQFAADTLLDTASGGIYTQTGAGVTFAGSALKIPAGSVVIMRPAGPSRWMMSTPPFARSSGETVIVVTGDTTIADQDPPATYQNTGASALVTVSLPLARAGKRVRLINLTATGIKALASTSSGDRIRNGTTLGAVGGYVSSTELGAVVELLAVDTTNWIVTGLRGTWTTA